MRPTSPMASMKKVNDTDPLIANWSVASAFARERKKRSYPQVCTIADFTTKRPEIQENEHVFTRNRHLSKKAFIESRPDKTPKTITLKQEYITTYSDGSTQVKNRTVEIVTEEGIETFLTVDDVFKAGGGLYWNITKPEIVGKLRVRRICYPRQVLIFLCATHTTASTTYIGKRFGGRDHSTVIHARDEVAKRILPNHPQFDQQTFDNVKALESVLQPELFGGRRTIPVSGETA